MKYCYISIFFVFNFFYLCGQSPSRLETLIEQSNKNYHANKAAFLHTLAAESQLSIIKNQFAPQLQVAYQLNYATYNNTTGMVFPSFLTPVSGPPVTNNVYSGVFGSAAALLAKWDVITFGYEKSLLQQANSQLSLSQAKEAVQIFRQNVQLSSIYLDWLLAEKLVAIYNNNTLRVQNALTLSQTLTQKGLRPGTDSASWSSEYANAKILLEQQRKSAATLFIQLQQWIGLDTLVSAADTVLLNKLPAPVQDSNSVQHPELQELRQEMENQKKQIHIIQQSAKPLLSLYGTAYARGSGADNLQDIKAFDGLYFQRYNYGIGAQLSVPLFEGVRTRRKIFQQQQLVNASLEDYQLTQWQLQNQMKQADTAWYHALQVKALTETQIQSSNFLFIAVTARYTAGLVSYTDVLLAQQQLIQSETDVEKARWEIWKAMLYKATIAGDLKLFLQQFKLNN